MYALTQVSSARKSPEKRGFFPPPVNGLNADAVLMGMRVSDAVLLENFVPYADRIETRPGYSEHVTGFSSTGRRLIPYAAPTGAVSLFATTDLGVYDVTSAGTLGGAQIALTNGKVHSAIIATGASAYLVLVNGTDSLVRFDGTNWSSVTTLGSTNTSEYSYVELYRQRLFFAKKQSRVLEYLPVNSISGTPTSYDLGAILRLGGYIVAIGTWTLDSGTGPDDYLAVLTSEGEVAVFTGNDPAYLATWTLRGVFFIGRPIGDRPMLKYGGDLLILTETGLYPLTAALQSAAIQRQSPISQRIRQLFSQAAKRFGGEYGWCMAISPQIPALIVNIPSSPVKQFVQNLQTGAWAVFTGWEANSFAALGSDVYFITDSFVAKMVGANDSGNNVTARLTQAYSRLSNPREKMVKLLKPYFTSMGGFYYKLGMAADFAEPSEVTIPSDNLEQFPGVWDTSNWGQVVWARTSATIESDWYTVPDDYSSWKALSLEVVVNSGIVTYAGCDLQYLLEQ